MVVSADVNGIEEWTEAQHRVIDLLSGLTADEAEVRVPACPDWTVRDLFSHMVGLGADEAGGDEPDDHNEAWTGRQVELRRGRSISELITEWRSVADPLRAWMAEHGVRPLGDVLIHEQDLRGALGVPGAQDTAGLAALREQFVERFRARLGELPPVALVGQGWEWTSGGPVSAAAVRVEAPTFELTRALMSRRSAAQLRGWTAHGDSTPYLDAFATLGGLPDADLSESVDR